MDGGGNPHKRLASEAMGAMDGMGDGLKRSRMDASAMGPAHTPVLFVRNLPNEASEGELHGLAMPFGGAVRVLLLKKQGKNQGFIQMHSPAHAQQLITYHASMPAMIFGQPVYFSYSNRQEITVNPPGGHGRDGGAGGSGSMGGGHSGPGMMRPSSDMVPGGATGNVILITIHNMLYPIDVHVVHQVFSKYGNVLKAIVFCKNGLNQALVQYDDAAAARNAKQMLEGQNIYPGCCTLKIQFSSLNNLTIKYNNDKSRDYTDPSLPSGDGGGGPPLHVLQQQSMMMPQQNYGGQQQFGGHAEMSHGFGGPAQGGFGGMGGGGYGGGASSSAAAGGGSRDYYGAPHHHGAGMGGMGGMGGMPPGGPPGYGGGYAQGGMGGGHMGMGMGGPMHMGGMGGPGGPGGPQGQTVLLINGLEPGKMDPDALFMLFGAYGDVVRVKILYNKRDSALIQFNTPQGAKTAMEHLNGVLVFGQKLVIAFSKMLHVSMPKPDTNPAIASLTKDFTNSPLHRYKYANSRNYQHICPPSATVHISNIPEGTPEESLLTLLRTYGAVEAFSFFQNTRKMALAKMSSVDEAINVLIYLHDYSINDHHLRVSFTKSSLDAPVIPLSGNPAAIAAVVGGGGASSSSATNTGASGSSSTATTTTTATASGGEDEEDAGEGNGDGSAGVAEEEEEVDE